MNVKQQANLKNEASGMPTRTICFHCQTDCEDQNDIVEDTKFFCCYGCLTVYQILRDESLGNYYKLKENAKTSSPLSHYNAKTSYDYLDTEKFEQENVDLKDNEKGLDFYLEGVHCLACLWLIERAKEKVPSIIDIRLNISSSIVKVRMNQAGQFSKVAEYFNKYGYLPHPITHDEEAKKLERKEEKKFLIKIAITAACAANIMLPSISIYSGAANEYLDIFAIICSVLFLPVLFYSATPFYKSALNALKMKKYSVDTPISFIIIAGGLISFYQVISGRDQFYFDSLSTFVLLLLISRYILKKAREKTSVMNSASSFFKTSHITKLNKQNNSQQTVPLESIQKGDHIRVSQDDTIPIDGPLLSAQAFLNTSFLTGEHLPVYKEKGEHILAGSICLDKFIDLEVENPYESSHLNGILNDVKNNWHKKTEAIQLADKVATWLLYTSLAVSFITFLFIYNQYDFATALSRSLAILIIACPCALAIGTPLTYANILNNLLRFKIIVKSNDVLEKLNHAKNIFFDKTGTLTEGNFQVVHFSSDKTSYAPIYSIESMSTHPIARSICRYIEMQNPEIQRVSLTDFEDNLGTGVSAKIKEDQWELKKNKENQSIYSSVSIFKNKVLIGEIRLQDEIKRKTKSLIEYLDQTNRNVFMITGDHNLPANQIATQLGIKEKNIFSNILPRQKSNIIKMHPHSIMVGDGLNDALAISDADIGIALGGKVDINLKSSDIFIPDSDIQKVSKLLQYSLISKKIIWRNLIISLIYNIFGITAGVLGFINPLVAAVLMPISSLTIIISTMIGTRIKILEEIK